MALITKYYRLFEIRILHEYFLLRDDQMSYFDLPEIDRRERLESRLSYGQYSLMQDITIQPDPETEKQLKYHRLTFIQTATGMTVASGSKVKSINGADVLFPKIALEEDLTLNFVIQVNNSFFNNYSSIPLSSHRSNSYFFNNATDTVRGSDFASLSQPAPTFVEGTAYLPGDIADHSGVLKEAYAHTSTEEYWEEIEEDGYVTESDRRCYGKTFMYQPSEAEATAPITFVLKDQAGEKTIKSFQIDKPTVRGVRVDFRMSKVEGMSGETPIPDGRYRLQIQTDVGETEQEVFLSSHSQSGQLGLIQIQVSRTGEMRILNEEGGLLTPHPIFEIRLRSRKTFWRYQPRHIGKKIEPVGTADFFHTEQFTDAQNAVPARQLITRRPQKLAKLPIQIRTQTGVQESFPQPRPSPLKVKPASELAPNEPPGRIFSDLYISHVEGKLKIVN